MNIKIKKGDLIKISPYKYHKQIILIGIVKNTGRSWISKKQFIKIKGVKLNTYGDILYFSYKVWEFDFDKIEFLQSLNDGRML